MCTLHWEGCWAVGWGRAALWCLAGQRILATHVCRVGMHIAINGGGCGGSSVIQEAGEHKARNCIPVAPPVLREPSNLLHYPAPPVPSAPLATIEAAPPQARAIAVMPYSLFIACIYASALLHHEPGCLSRKYYCHGKGSSAGNFAPSPASFVQQYIAVAKHVRHYAALRNNCQSKQYMSFFAGVGILPQ